MTLAVIFAYLGLVLLIGGLSHRLFRGTGEDYFLATRTIGPFVLLMSLFGTHMTAFSLLGASGESYHSGIGVFGLMASSSAIVVPVVFFVIGTRLWALGKRYGYMTQVQFFRDRWRSDTLGLLLFVVLIALVIPYLLIGVMGGAQALNQITDGQVPEWAGGLLICLVVMTYVTYGGLRGTAWANTFQTLVFMTLGAVTFWIIVDRMGGLGSAMAQVAAARPELMVREGSYSPVHFFTYSLIPLSVGMFPHIFMHWLTARRAGNFRVVLVAYPLCVAVVWVPSVLLGVLGTVAVPGLEGAASNSILVRLIGMYAPGVLAGLLGAGVVAAIMSSLDSQILSIGTMFTQDIVRHHGYHDRMSDRLQVLVGRLFVAGLLALTWLLSLVSNRSIFGLGTWSFTGFAALMPVVVAALFWKRSTKEGAIASVLTVVGLWLYFFLRGGAGDSATIGDTGIMPVAVILLASSLAMLVVSLLTRPPESAVVERFFPPSGEPLRPHSVASATASGAPASRGE